MNAWDELALAVWDVDIYEHFDRESKTGCMLATYERCRSVYLHLKGMLDGVKPDGSKWRQRASYIGVEAVPTRKKARLVLSR